MTIELSEREKQIVEKALLKLNYLYEDWSAHAYAKGCDKNGLSNMENANEVWLLYLKIKENDEKEKVIV